MCKRLCSLFRGLKMQFDGHLYKPLHLKQIVRAKDIEPAILCIFDYVRSMDAFVELQARSIKLRSFCAHICTYIYTKGQERAQKFALLYLKTPFCKKTSLVRQAC